MKPGSGDRMEKEGERAPREKALGRLIWCRLKVSKGNSKAMGGPLSINS